MNKRNNIILLLALCILLMLMGCYLLMLAPDVYKVVIEFSTLNEYNTYRLMIGEKPALESKFSPVYISTNIVMPRSQSFPYGEKATLNTNLSLACFAVSLISLAFLAYELQSKRKNRRNR